MKVYVGVTDTAWYQHLAARPAVTDVNFWLPGGGGFGAIQPGELFVFKSKYPENRLVGSGLFDGSITLPISDAWRIFGEGNGVANLTALRESIGKYRGRRLTPLEDPEIGCVMLSATSFLEPLEQVPAPPDWPKNIVRGKTYDGVQATSIVESMLTGLLSQHHNLRLVEGPVFGEPHLAPTRLGQGAFKALVLNAYNRRCAVTGDKIRPVLQAAHIRPVSHGGANRLDNGILLRSDVHTLFDNGYLAVDEQYCLRVSPRLRAEFGNGEEFYRLDHAEISVPRRSVDKPNREFLEWHRDTLFLSA